MDNGQLLWRSIEIEVTDTFSCGNVSEIYRQIYFHYEKHWEFSLLKHSLSGNKKGNNFL